MLLELVFNSFTDAKPILIGVNGPISTQILQTAKALNKDFEILDVNYGSAFRTKLGFVEIGRKPNAFKIQDRYRDEILMVKEL